MPSRLGATMTFPFENGTLNVFPRANSSGHFCCEQMTNRMFQNSLLAIFQMATNNVDYTRIETAMYGMNTVKRNTRLANCLKGNN